ncbi:MAG TPA: TonB-dependent receptor [Blastocatellia bacterium]|nr:TonB-dependent receptor [Blastocatellia bacterium]
MKFFIALRSSLHLLLLIVMLAPLGQAQPTGSITGVVVDATGAVIPKTDVMLSSTNNFRRSAQTDEQGRFLFDQLPLGNYELQFRAPGFEPMTKAINVNNDGATTLRVELRIAVSREGGEVSSQREPEFLATRQATVITTFSPRQIQQAGAQTVDDLLRQVPGFSNFRRSSSIVANPTAQGVSLRGAGASGASRTVVLADGIPLNDAFGGWVYWDRIPREAIQSIEVERGGASHLYGSDALSGIISLNTRSSVAPTISASASYGNLQTGDVSFFAGNRFGKLNLATYGEAYRTDGYFIIAPEIRGLADTRAASEHRTITVRTGFDFDANNTIFARGSLYDQDRKNGTVLQVNDTKTESLAVAGKLQTPDKSSWTIALYANQQRYHQSFTGVAANRNSETLTRLQAAPSRDVGARLNWAHATNGSHTLFAGFEVRGVRGTSDEIVYANNRATTFVSSGGRQRRIGFFAQDYLALGKRWALAISGRYDQWRDSSAGTVSRSLTTGAITPTFFAARTASAFSPRVALLFRPTAGVELRAAGYRAFRAPTLNELYRGFRVGDTQTNANANLTAERLTGGEAGLSWAINSKVSSRLTGYYTEIINPVSNFTISVTPTLITRQRRNLGRTRSSGLEAEIEMKVTEQIRFSSGYLFADAVFKRAPQDVRLEGLWIPQVPRHQFTMQASYFNPSIVNAALQFRAAGKQFDDDQNLLPLSSYALIDANISRSLGRYFEAFFAVQNLLDERVVVGRTPLETFGMPRMFRGGIRIRLER